MVNSVRENSSLKIVVAVLVSALVMVLLAPMSANAANGTLSDEKVNAVANSAYYNSETKLYEFDEAQAKDLGLTSTEAATFNSFFENLSLEEVEAMNEAIGFDPNASTGDFSTQALPAVLIPIAAFLGTTIGGVIITEVTLYGIQKACQNLQGEAAFFDDFCSTRGYT
ncbi:hypothetical protein SFC66_12235 [Terribacillus saccharophilus]|uniref:hypothetical protein n=1 Tax=Terribacillus saccharophilus TaxID=361277 RepID=UPI0039826AEF